MTQREHEPGLSEKVYSADDGMSVDTWQSALSETACRQALDAVSYIAGQLANPDRVQEIAQRAAQQTFALFHMNRHTDLNTYGFMGVTLPFIFFARAFPERAYLSVAHHYLRLAAQCYHQVPPEDVSLFYGYSGLAAMTSLLSEEGKHYRRTLDALNQHISQQVCQRQWRRDAGVSSNDYDIFGGAAGTLCYLLTVPSPDASSLAAIDTLLDYLIWLSDNDEHTKLPRWYIPQEFLSAQWQKDLYPEGNFDCGMSHGIAGPLAALALAWRRGYRRTGQKEAMTIIAQWLMRYALHDPWGINWAALVPLSAVQSGNTDGLQPSRASWCHGSPGIARALWLAGSVLGLTDVQTCAIEAMEAVLNRPDDVRDIDNPILCHGNAGLLLFCLRFAHETKHTLFQKHIPLLATRLLEQFESGSPVGFRILLSDEENESSIVTDIPDWLNGATGAALTLLAAGTSFAPLWDHFLLLS